MKNKEIKQRYKEIIRASTPDVLNQILENCDKRESEVFEMNDEYRTNRRGLFIKIASVMAMFMICIFGAIGYNQSKVETLISLDVNPSVEMKLNKKGKVVNTQALNKDGEKILENIKVSNENADTAVTGVVDSMIENGYINEYKNSVLLSVRDKDLKKGEELKEKLEKEIDKKLKEKEIEGAILSQVFDGEDKEERKLAKEHNMSIGKAKLILDILEEGLKNNNGELVTFEELEGLTINELNNIATTKKIELKEITSTGTASQKEYIGEEKAKNIAFEHARVNSSNVKGLKVNLDFERGKFIYEVEFIVDEIEYEYEIDAKTGNINKNEKEKADKEDLIEANKLENTNSNITDEQEQKREKVKREYKVKEQQLDKKEDEIDMKKDRLELQKDELEKEEKRLEQEKKTIKDEYKIKEIEEELSRIEKEKDKIEAEIEKLNQEEDKIEQEERRLKEEYRKAMNNIK